MKPEGQISKVQSMICMTKLFLHHYFYYNIVIPKHVTIIYHPLLLNTSSLRMICLSPFKVLCTVFYWIIYLY